jgi:hypothetical protein
MVIDIICLFPRCKNISYFQLEMECEMKPLEDLSWKHGKMDNKNNQQCSCKIICQSHECNKKN